MTEAATHTCPLCAPQSTMRISENGRFHYPARFVGPPGSVHGGMAVAALTCAALQGGAGKALKDPRVTFVSGRLSAPLPLEKDLAWQEEPTGEGTVSLTLLDGEKTLLTGEARLSEKSNTPRPAPPALAEHLAAMAREVNAAHEGPSVVKAKRAHLHAAGEEDHNNCYGCSEKPHALKISSWALASGDLLSSFEPEDEHLEEDGTLSSAAIAAALDCSNLWVLFAEEEDLGVALQMKEQKGWLTGTHAVHFLRPAPADKTFRIVTRHLETTGRKAKSIAGLYDTEGTLYAVAEDILIQIDWAPFAASART